VRNIRLDIYIYLIDLFQSMMSVDQDGLLKVISPELCLALNRQYQQTLMSKLKDLEEELSKISDRKVCNYIRDFCYQQFIKICITYLILT